MLRGFTLFSILLVTPIPNRICTKLGLGERMLFA